MAQVSSSTPGAKINDPSEKVIRTRSTFPQMSYEMYNTHRFGEYSPFFVMEGVEGDKIPIRSSHNVRSMSLKAPLMQDIKRNKDFYMVPMEAILPLNWEKFYCNPTLGDDVGPEVGCSVTSFWSLLGTRCSNILSSSLYSYLADTTKTDANKLTYILHFLVFLEYFYSDGSLMCSLGCHGSQKMRIKILDNTLSGAFHNLVDGGLDAFFDLVCADIVGHTTSFTALIDGQPREVITSPGLVVNSGMGITSPAISLHDFLQYMRDDLNVSITAITGSPLASWSYINTLFDSSKISLSFSAESDPYNLSRLWAYQLSCAHFYSNDHVDYIYSAELLRNLVRYHVTVAYSNSYTQNNAPQFTYNGVAYAYDAMCGYFLRYILNDTNQVQFLNPESTIPRHLGARGYFSVLFSYKRSLRYVDYFTGCRTRPLAVGNVDANVVSNKVNVVDITQNIQKQRFLNAVNRFGRKFREYIDGLSGVTPAVDYHNPLYLGHTSDSIYGIETENTGAAQVSAANSITSRLQSNGARYQFEVSVDRPCVIIGISYYDIKRVYITTTDRQLLHRDRFDMFNPFMQFVGDQELSIAELGSKRYFSSNWAFGYQLRHMEYKQRFPVGAGGFVRALPGWIFDNRADDDRALTAPVQSDDFIRSLNSELDRFFVSLTGYSLGTYFHFEVCDYNDCEPSRPMAYAPSIL